MNIIVGGSLFVLTILFCHINCTEDVESTTGCAQFFADPDDSNKYYVSLKGRLLKLTCVSALQWNDVLKLKACNWPPNVNFEEVPFASVQPIVKAAKKVVCYCEYQTPSINIKLKYKLYISCWI